MSETLLVLLDVGASMHSLSKNENVIIIINSYELIRLDYWIWL